MTYRIKGLIASCLLAGIVAWHVEVPSVSLKFRDFFLQNCLSFYTLYTLLFLRRVLTVRAVCIFSSTHTLSLSKIAKSLWFSCTSSSNQTRGFCKLNQPSSNTCLEARSQSIAAADVVIDAQTWWHCLTSFIFHPVVFRS